MASTGAGRRIGTGWPYLEDAGQGRSQMHSSDVGTREVEDSGLEDSEVGGREGLQRFFYASERVLDNDYIGNPARGVVRVFVFFRLGLE